MDRETRFELLATSILEGGQIDWADLESGTSAEERDLVAQLRIVAEIAALHRTAGAAEALAHTTAVTQADQRGRVWGHLQIRDLLGRGTFGEVYRAWDPQLEREVALKLLRSAPDPAIAPASSVSVRDPLRVVHEGRLLARVRHPHVITVFGADSRDGKVGIWMEFIRGRTLHQIVSEQGQLGAREAAAIGLDLAGALAAVHAAGLLHRDVAARNVMREQGGRIVLMDFGAGHEQVSWKDPARGSQTAGTPLYMAPELLEGGHADQRSDLYALGVLLFFLVTGAYPVSGRSIAEIRAAHQHGARKRLRDTRPDLPSEFIGAVEVALAPNPADRCQTAAELDLALSRAIQAPTGAPSGKRWWKSTPALTAVTTLGLGAVLYLSYASGRSTTGEAPSGRPPVPLSPPTTVIARKLPAPGDISLFSNPSDDGRFVAGMVNATGDAAIVDLATAQYRPLEVRRAAPGDGYASLLALSSDGRNVAVDWHIGDKGTLIVVPTDGSPPRVLLDQVADVFPHQWSRDGSVILTLITGNAGVNTIAFVAANDGAVRSLRQLGVDTPGRMALSPDARYVVYDYPERAGDHDRDLFILDTHTGAHGPLVASPGLDTSPSWSADGRSVVFLSDRRRSLGLWALDIENGRASSAPRLAKDDVGRVWLRGFTASGALHYQWWAGFAEVYVATLDANSAPQPISPRQAISNFFPMWSADGRFLAYGSERRAESGRQLTLFDAESNRETLLAQQVGRPFGWSPDARRVLVRPNGNVLAVVDRETGAVRQIARGVLDARWIAAGIVARTSAGVKLYDTDSGRIIRSIDVPNTAISAAGPAWDGRTMLTWSKNSQLVLHDVASGRTREWHDQGISTLRDHVMALHSPMVAYTGPATGVPDVMSLRVWPGSGDPRELLRVRDPERVAIAGWTPDGRQLLVIRRVQPSSPGPQPPMATVWRVPVNGASPTPTSLAMEGLRDLSIHPDGRTVAFNAGFKRAEYWVLENLLAH